MKIAPEWQQKNYGYRIIFYPRYSIELYRGEDGWLSAFVDEPIVYDTDLALPFRDALRRILEFARGWGISEEDIRTVEQTAPVEV